MNYLTDLFYPNILVTMSFVDIFILVKVYWTGKVASSIQFTNVLEILSLYFHISLHLV